MAAADSAVTLQGLFNDALRHHQAGRLAEATELYRQILAADAQHAHTLQLLGVIAHQSGRHSDAVELIGRAIILKDDEPVFHLHMGLALKSQGRLDEAVASYDRALRLKADFAEAYSNQSVALRAAGMMEAALAACERALTHKPNAAEAHSNRGDVLKDLGRPDEAVASYDRALALRPGLATTHFGRGNALMALGRTAEAIVSFDRALALRADYADCHARRADALHAQRNLVEALDGYDRAIALKPDLVEVLHNRGNVLNELGRSEEAVASYDRALALQPELAETHNNRANVLRDRGADDLAIAGYDRAIALKPELVQAHHNRGNVLGSRGKLEEAVASYDQALAVKPDHAEVLVDRGTALKNLGHLDEAIASYERSFELGTDYALAHTGLAEALHRRGRKEEALSHYERAVALDPGFALAHHGLGSVLGDLGRPEEALASYDRALAIDPELADTHNNRANLLHGQGKYDEAIAGYDRAIAVRPDFATAHYNRANAFNNQGKFDVAIASYDQTIALKPDYAAAHCNRGVALRNLGLAEAANESFARAQALEPSSFEYASLARLSLPIIMSSASEIAEQRTRYRQGIAEMTSFEGRLDSLDATNSTYIFYLAYNGLDDRPILEEVGAMFRAKAPSLTFEAPHTKDWQAPRGKRRIRIGFASEYFREHTIEKLNRGLIRHLDRTRFEVVLLHAPQAKRDAFSDRLDDMADRAVTLPQFLPMQQQAIAEQGLDVLFYPDIGMSKDTYFLAYARLAPVQVVSWGHPNTTGLDSIDYFVSSDGAEPEGAESYYTERLVRLSRLPCFYEQPEPADEIPGRVALGLPESGTLYGCPQSLFKFHPDFDAILADIVAGDPTGHIVVIEGLHPTWNDLLRRRWARSHPALLERVRILRRQPLNRFMALMSHFDVLLDPIHFGSGNTLYEAMATGTPVVTWPGNFMRGRIVAEAYRQMGVARAPVARALQEYAPLALALGRDPPYRASLRRTLREGARALFEDRQAVREFETFVCSAVDAAARGTRLPAGWRPRDQDAAAP